MSDTPDAVAGHSPAPRAGSDSDLLVVDGLRVTFPISGRSSATGSRVLVAVDEASFTVARGETFALVGESGSGKTTVARTIVRLQSAEAGRVWLDGVDLLALSGERLRKERRKFQMVFQDPYSSLNPRRTVGDTIAEPMVIHGIHDRQARRRRVLELFDQVGLPSSVAERRPHEFSGGQRQRVGIARALAANPALLVCDEPVSALDVSVRAQVVNLLVDLQTELGLTYVFISHDLALVRQVATSVAVMYLGRIVEIGPAAAIYEEPRHPYTIAMLSAVPVPDTEVERQRERIILRGDIPSPVDPPPGCRFSTRCWLRERLGDPEACTTEDPGLVKVGPDHAAACHFTESAAEARPSRASAAADERPGD